MLQALLLVMLGGAVGSGARYLTTHFSWRISHDHGFPYGTLAVNVIGSFIVGYVLTWSADHAHDRWRLLAATGFCGGFTTFSTFAFETMGFIHTGEALLAVLNVVLNNTLAFLALWCGIWAHRSHS
jgi:CrcB protein